MVLVFFFSFSKDFFLQMQWLRSSPVQDVGRLHCPLSVDNMELHSKFSQPMGMAAFEPERLQGICEL